MKVKVYLDNLVERAVLDLETKGSSSDEISEAVRDAVAGSAFQYANYDVHAADGHFLFSVIRKFKDEKGAWI